MKRFLKLFMLLPFKCEKKLLRTMYTVYFPRYFAMALLPLARGEATAEFNIIIGMQHRVL